ncbi:ArsR/SmtB family transcription factor [Deinococcus humi]|uniref:DNA-binding transcriptional ArsR family regulator n=1 Tax=Deinococcus humi TaxID=662880 RepID=A0A7W8NCU9_9DEIO|nr:metalloregulator ArsR/SmtB family transcription factor [Deinococcus humi]MBB5362609.1 DNA-binding transcriptional ArsR family regulator [Deinococcus humi]
MRTVSQQEEAPADVCEVNCVHPDAVAQARTELPGGQEVETASAFLKLVGDPTRLKILSALKARELCVCDLAAVVGLSESAVSHQLRLLRTGRVVTFRKAGRVAYYRLLDHHVTLLIENALEHVRE